MSMRTPIYLSASLDALARFARGGLTLGLAATLVGPMGCDTVAPTESVQIVTPPPSTGLTPYTGIVATLPSEPLCILDEVNETFETSAGPPVDNDMAFVEPEQAFESARAPRSLARQETAPWRSGRAIAASPEELFVVDTANGMLVVLDPSDLTVLRSTLFGATTRPEQVVVGPEGDAWVTLRHGRSVAHVPAGAEEADLTIDVGVEPYGLALSPDGSRLYVTVAGEDELAVLDGVTGERLSQAQTAPHPRGVVFTDRETVVVVHQDAGVLEYAIASDGTLGSVVQEQDVRVGNPWQIASMDSLAQELFGLEEAPSSHFGTRAVAVATDPERGDVYVAHVQVAPGTVEQLLFTSLNGLNSQMPNAEPSDGDSAGEAPEPGVGGGSAYGMGAATRFNTPFRPVEPSITRLHSGGTHGTTSMVAPVGDSEDRILAHRLDQPMDIHHHPTASLLFVVGQGTDNVLVFNSAMEDPMASPVAEISVGHGPRAITFSADGGTAFVLNSHAYTVGAIDLSPLLALSAARTEGCGGELDTLTETLSLGQATLASYGADPLSAAVQRGRRIFHNSRNNHLNGDDQFACATCHLEGQEDKRVWLVLEGQRQTPSLAGRLLDTGPFNWQGTEDELQDNMSQTIERMGGLGLDPLELADLEQFMLHGLVAPPNPHVVTGELSEEQAWGKEIFQRPDVGCATCHAGQGTTDGLLHDVGTASELETGMFEFAKDFGGDVDFDELQAQMGTFNTPSLRGLFYTAPYLHDGSAMTLRDVLLQTATTMGRTDHLAADEIDALVAYLLTL